MNQPASGPQKFAGRGLRLAALALAGCVSLAGAGPDARFKRLSEKLQEASERAQRCKRGVIEDANARIGSTAARSGALTAAQLQEREQEREKKLSECDAEARREEAALLQRERTEYQLSAQQEHDLAALMSQLTASRPR